MNVQLKKMSYFIKKFLLVILGIILSLVVLECGLRLTGWGISYYQQYRNNKALRSKSQYTIMCLGESTTAGQYLIQLQQILDKKYPDKFSVIDCGIPGAFLKNILDSLEHNITKYNPNIAICMMGINNGLVKYEQIEDVENIEYIKKSKNINLKIYNLCLLIKNHIVSLLKKEVFANVNTKNQDMYKYAIELKEKGKFKEAESQLKDILKIETDNEMAFIELMILYSDFLGERNIGYNMAIEALNKNFSYSKEWCYRIIFDFISENRNDEEMKYYINKAINQDIKIFSTREKYNIYNCIKKQLTENEKYKILDIMSGNNDTYYGMIGIEKLEQKGHQEAEKYFDKAEEIRLNFPNTETYNLYKLIIKKLIDNNIKVICMQYPMRSILPLEEQLKNEPYYDKLTFVSNEALFKKALMKRSYDEIFSDQFAGDFGHCTELGNTLIAKNIVNTLETMFDLKK